MNELIIGFGRLNNVDLVAKARQITAALSTSPGNVYYPNPEPTVTDVDQEADALAAANAQTTSVPVTELRNSLRVPLIEVLQLLAMNLETTTPGDRTKLAYTGYDLRKIPEHSHQVPETPSNIRVSATGTNGGIIGKCAPPANSDYYEMETTANPVTGPWSTPIVSTNSQNIPAQGFTRGTDVYIRIRAVNTNGPSPWSEVGDTMVA